ncbi:hypothetical protein CIG58_12390 [Klebsiella oxytoca]|nr:hypothetical protein CIG58_12390 [Klebsiella oxytoca]
MEISPRLALRLAGLQVYSRLMARSRARRFAPPPGADQRPHWIWFPGGDAAHLSGLPLADGDGPVARARRFAPPPGEARTIAQ